MSKNGKIFLTIGIIFCLGRLGFRIYSEYDWNTTIGSYWDLSERASTISQKSEYMDKYVGALEAARLEGTNSATFLKTPATSFDENMKALLSLQSRLHDIDTMSESGFAYQTAISQITEQEQGQAQDMNDNLSSCWEKVNYYTLWNKFIWITFLLVQIALIGIPLAPVVFD
jgi:hypothetical protein